jgi:hypothetical protein
MSHRVVIAMLFLLGALVVVTSGNNLSRQSKAATGESYEKLISDPNFVRAVKSIAEACSVNVDVAKLKC